jgi:hypothetical protein
MRSALLLDEAVLLLEAERLTGVGVEATPERS